MFKPISHRARLICAATAVWAGGVNFGWAENPGEADSRAGQKAKHWSWSAIQNVTPPQVKLKGWPRDPIDRFILARLETRGLTPAPPADRRTWIRRVTFDLTGLPPTPQHVHDFLNDQSEQAFENVVDRLLASPRYGERWGRHWLDLVRYADSYGHEFDYTIPHAHAYRDYVIRAFNQDVPYDLWLAEHVAGDLLENPRFNPEDQTNESIVGTGFWFLHEAVHAPTDVKGDEAERIDNQIDVFSKTFLGLTLACARCHDHKFDPISIKDYYAMSGFLQSSRQQTAMLDPNHKIRDAARQLKALHSRPVDTAQLLDFLKGIKVPENLTEDHPLFAMAKLKGATRSPNEFSSQKGKWAEHLRQARERFETEKKDAEIIGSFDDSHFENWQVTGEAFGSVPVNGTADSGHLSPKLEGVLRSPTFELKSGKISLRIKGSKASARLIIDGYQMEVYNGLLFNGTRLKNIDTKGEFKWFHLGNNMYTGHRAYVEFTDQGDGYIAVDEVRQSPRAASAVKPDGTSMAILQDKTVVDTDTLFMAYAEQARSGPFRTWVMRNGFINKQKAAIERTIPKPLYRMAMTDGTGEDEYVFLRGKHTNKGAFVPRRLPESLTGKNQSAIKEGSGRLELVRRLLDRSNPYPSRVMVNRIWHHLFGRGIVPTTDDFGAMGRPPSHPELLDWLAEDFRSNSWGVKRIIRRIVLSQTYRMTGKHPAEHQDAETIDPENILLHRMPIRRLQAEAIRDAVLQVSGRLDPTMYGPGIPVFLTAFHDGRGKPKSGPMDGKGRRSIYLAVRRNFLSTMMLTFDFPTPFSTIGRRTVSNVPAQALVMMNNPFVQDLAGLWAKKIMAERSETADRIQQIYETAFARPASKTEMDHLTRFIQSQAQHYQADEQDHRVWKDVCHVVFNMKEFIYLN